MLFRSKQLSEKQRIRATEGWKKRKNTKSQSDATAYATAYTTADAAALPYIYNINNNNTITKLEDIVISKTSNNLKHLKEKERKEEKKEKEILITHPLQIFVRDNCPQVAKLKKQLSAEDCEKLLAKYSNTQVANVLTQMENFKQLPTKYISVYLTLNNWLSRQPNEQSTRNNNRGANYEDALRNF